MDAVNAAAEAAAQERGGYEPPEIVDYGDLVDLTAHDRHGPADAPHHPFHPPHPHFST
jgi:hypothetical protein